MADGVIALDDHDRLVSCNRAAAHFGQPVFYHGRYEPKGKTDKETAFFNCLQKPL